MAILVPKLVGLRQEINSVAPDRDKESDGWIGNANHQTYVSGHNPDETGLSEFKDPDSIDEVRAIDVDADLRRDGLTMTKIANYLRLECKAGRIDWIHYIIWNKKIASAKSGWSWVNYNGYNSHTKHMHVSGNLKSDYAPYKEVGLRNLVEGVYPMLCKRGDKGQNVIALQVMLSTLGFSPGNIDGDYGELTAKALYDARTSMGLNVKDGGANYDGWAYAQIHRLYVQKLGQPGPAGPAGPPGPPGKTAVLPSGTKLQIVE